MLFTVEEPVVVNILVVEKFPNLKCKDVRLNFEL